MMHCKAHSVHGVTCYDCRLANSSAQWAAFFGNEVPEGYAFTPLRRSKGAKNKPRDIMKCIHHGETLRTEEGRAVTRKCGTCPNLPNQVVFRCASTERAAAGLALEVIARDCAGCGFFAES